MRELVSHGSVDVDYASVAILAQVCVVCGLGFIVRHELVLTVIISIHHENGSCHWMTARFVHAQLHKCNFHVEKFAVTSRS